MMGCREPVARTALTSCCIPAARQGPDDDTKRPDDIWLTVGTTHPDSQHLQ